MRVDNPLRRRAEHNRNAAGALVVKRFASCARVSAFLVKPLNFPLDCFSVTLQHARDEQRAECPLQGRCTAVFAAGPLLDSAVHARLHDEHAAASVVLARAAFFLVIVLPEEISMVGVRAAVRVGRIVVAPLALTRLLRHHRHRRPSRSDHG